MRQIENPVTNQLLADLKRRIMVAPVTIGGYQQVIAGILVYEFMSQLSLIDPAKDGWVHWPHPVSITFINASDCYADLGLETAEEYRGAAEEDLL